jgi:hypothetical protein
MRPRVVGVATVVGAVAGYAGLQWLGRAAGSTKAERSSQLAGDDLVAEPMMRTTHAITINAPPECVWPWLVQMGWHRGQWYTARWVDRLFFPNNAPSADRIVPELQDLAVGDWIPDGPPATECGFRVKVLEPERHLVLHSTEHLPPDFAERFGAWIDWSWSFVLQDLGNARTRFIFRTRLRLGPPWLAAGYWALLIPADFVMSHQMLHGVKSRAEALAG